MIGIIWGPPPPPSIWRWADRLKPFMARPGEWGQLEGSFDRRTIRDLRAGHHVLPSGGWEFQHRTVPDHDDTRRIYIWARYLGPGD